MPQANTYGQQQYGFGYPGFGGAAGGTPGMPQPVAGAGGAGAVGSPGAPAPGADASAAAGQQAQWGANPNYYQNFWGGMGGEFLLNISIVYNDKYILFSLGYYGQPAGGQGDGTQQPS